MMGERNILYQSLVLKMATKKANTKISQDLQSKET